MASSIHAIQVKNTTTMSNLTDLLHTMTLSIPGLGLLLALIAKHLLIFSNPSFQPTTFSINAIGMILLLCESQIANTLGSLVDHDYLEWLPILSSHTIASSAILQPLPGHRLYNVSDKIMALDPAAWFTKWLGRQDITYVGSVIRLSHLTIKPKLSTSSLKMLDLALSTVVVTGLTLLAAKQRDGYGILFTFFTCVTIICRIVNLRLLRLGFAGMVKDSLPSRTGSNNGYTPHDVGRCWVTMPNGHSVQIVAPRGLVRCLLTTPKPAYHGLYTVSQYLCGAAFLGQTLTLGNTGSIYQATAIVTTALATMALLAKNPSSKISGELDLVIEKPKKIQSHMGVYADMGMDDDEEESMRLWGLMPHKANHGWWNTYYKLKTEKAGLW